MFTFVAFDNFNSCNSNFIKYIDLLCALLVDLRAHVLFSFCFR